MAEPSAGEGRIEMVDLRAQRRRLGRRIDEAVATVLEHACFILGPEVARLESELARRFGARHVVGCSSGTDALLLALLAWRVGPGDAVFVPAFTFAATAEVVVLAGATPVFVDVRPDTFNIDADSLAAAVRWAPTAGLRPVGTIAVDLFGQPADYGAVYDVAAEHNLWVLADAAQSLGATLEGRPVGSLAHITATSFFPAKPLGCYGDGGAVFTDDDELGASLRSLRVHGRAAADHHHDRTGINGRLDTVQAAILLTKLEVFDEEHDGRRQVAARYDRELAGVVEPPAVLAGARPAWACYTVLATERDRMAEELRSRGVSSAVYYPMPLHHQVAFARFPTAPGGLPVCERLPGQVLSLPVHAYLDRSAQDRVIDAVCGAVGSRQ